MIEAALVESGGRVSGPLGAAAKLGIPPSTLESKIRSLKINKHHFKDPPRCRATRIKSFFTNFRKIAKDQAAAKPFSFIGYLCDCRCSSKK